MVNPSAVYGLGPIASPSFERDLFEPIVRRKRRARRRRCRPGGCGVVFSEGVAAGHLLAAERGRPGERYILCDRHVTLKGAGRGGRDRRRPRLRATGPARLAWRARWPPLGEPLARLIGKPPLLPRGQLHFFRWNAVPDSSKAQDELGWEPTPLERGLRETLTSMGLA